MIIGNAEDAEKWAGSNEVDTLEKREIATGLCNVRYAGMTSDQGTEQQEDVYSSEIGIREFEDEVDNNIDPEIAELDFQNEMLAQTEFSFADKIAQQ